MNIPKKDQTEMKIANLGYLVANSKLLIQVLMLFFSKTLKMKSPKKNSVKLRFNSHLTFELSMAKSEIRLRENESKQILRNLCTLRSK